MGIKLKVAMAVTVVVITGTIGAGYGSSVKRDNAVMERAYAGSVSEPEPSQETTTTAVTAPVSETTTMQTKPVTTTTVTTTAATTTQPLTTAKPAPPVLKVENAQIEATSVSELKVTWDAEEDRTYTLGWETEAPYSENIEFVFYEDGTAYLTGLRIDSEYKVTITPELKEGEDAMVMSAELVGHTPNIEVIQDFEREEGWTSCFAGERASGLTAMPSSGAIYGSQVDNVTGTGIRRFENGDYCCAMGVWYGYCGDRFLIELDNGIQFTTRICDSKGFGDDGEGKYHNFGNGGKCVVEFIYDDYNLPSCVAFSGSWGYYDWNGLDLCSNIKSIQKLATW